MLHKRETLITAYHENLRILRQSPSVTEQQIQDYSRTEFLRRTIGITKQYYAEQREKS